MANKSVMEQVTDPTWRVRFDHESHIDRAERKLLQAEALAVCLVGENEDPIGNYNDVLRQQVRSLLADTISEAREAFYLARSPEGRAQ